MKDGQRRVCDCPPLSCYIVETSCFCIARLTVFVI